MAFQNVHSPVQAPKENVEKYAFIEDRLRRTYAGMVDIMDEAVGNITDAFKEAGYFIINNNIKQKKNLYASLKKPFLRTFLYLLTLVCHTAGSSGRQGVNSKPANEKKSWIPSFYVSLVFHQQHNF